MKTKVLEEKISNIFITVGIPAHIKGYQFLREAIKMAWQPGSRQAWDWYFSYEGRPVTNKPTNSEFISRIAYILEIWQECKITRGDCNERE